MLNGNSETVWATLWKPEVSLNWLPCVRNMRTDLLTKEDSEADVNIRAKNCLKFIFMLTEWFSQFQ